MIRRWESIRKRLDELFPGMPIYRWNKAAGRWTEENGRFVKEESMGNGINEIARKECEIHGLNVARKESKNEVGIYNRNLA